MTARPSETKQDEPQTDPKRGARLREAERRQIRWGRVDLEAALPEDHPARAICAVIDRLDLGALYGQVRARDEVLALLMQHELIDLNRVAQDGTRVRASAGAASFRRAETLDHLMAEARAHLEQVIRAAADPALSARRAAALKRAAEERIERLQKALAQIPEVAQTKRKSGAKDREPRASTTDEDARVMKMGDGGFRPAYNIQFATTTDAALVIVGVSASNRGSDMGQSTPMLHQIEQRTGVRPAELLVDGGYAKHEAIDEAVTAWRARMATDEAKEIYKKRAATAETVNADGKAHRGLDSMVVRGIEKVTGSACLFALTYNILRCISLSC